MGLWGYITKRVKCAVLEGFKQAFEKIESATAVDGLIDLDGDQCESNRLSMPTDAGEANGTDKAAAGRRKRAD